jgi:dynein heavy chain
MPYFNILVPTSDTTLTSHLVTLLLSVNRNFLLSGETGVGKTVMLQDFLHRSSDTLANVSAVFSAQTSSKNLQDALEMKLEKKRKGVLGPPAGKKMAVFVDDLNMPQPEVYGAQPPIELLRQIMDNGGFYDRKKLTFNKVKDVVFMAACGPPGGGRNKVTSRVVRHYHLIWQPQLSRFSMMHIFVSILQGFLAFSPNLAAMAKPITEASVEIYTRIASELLPTPSKSHYTFNLRDLSKVVQGILMVAKDCLPTRESLLNLWLHESARVFRDRLIDEKDCDWFNSACESSLQQYFGVDWKPEQFRDILFGDYLTQGDVRPYKECPDYQQVVTMMNSHLADYNELCAKMDLVLFRDAINHLSRVCRILRQPRGNALLVGVGGSGRQSLTRLAAFIVGQYKVMSIEITRGYGIEAFREDIKKLLMVAGGKNQPVVFLFSDSQIVKESFLEDINNLLNSGEVPNLFAPDELDSIVQMVRPFAKAAGKFDNRDNILAHFTYLVRENLHIVLAFSPIGDKFRARCRRFPSLVNCCTIDWYSAWPQDALFSVADYFFKSNAELGIADVQHELCQICVKIHSSVSEISGRFFDELRRHNYTTPTSYLELINIYTGMLTEQRRDIQSRVKRYAGGYLKLQETNTVVEQLQVDLTRLQPVLVQASKDTAQLLVDLQRDQAEASVQREQCAQDAAECETTAARVKVIKDDCQNDLDQALPAYEEAIKSLNTLNKDHIGEVKRFANPPALVAFCMEAVCILFGRKPTWPDSQKLLGEMDFLDQCKNFPRDKISAATLKKLNKYVTNPDFKPEKMASVSSAATSLCKWANAMNIYATVAKDIEPKKKALEDAENELQRAQNLLFAKQESLRVVENRLAALQLKYEESVAKKQQLEDDAQKTVLQLGRAEQLVSGLGAEGARWSATADSLQLDLVNVVGNMILSAGCIAYLGPFTASYRAELVQNWVDTARSLKIPVDPNFKLTRVLGDPVKIREWTIAGLPADQYSTENGIFVSRTRRWPLMIDPQGQANRWMKNMYKKAGLNVIKFSESNFLRSLENAIRYGKPVLLENVETTLDPAIEPVLLKQVTRKGGQLMLRLGDADIPYSTDFRLELTTKLPNPHYLPETFVKVTIINFTVTPRGLEDQLLVAVCSLERADLEERNDSLVVQVAADQAQLAAIEDEILSRLSNSQGFILDDEELINALGQSKIKSREVKESLIEAEKTMEEISVTREKYRVVALRGSTLYFVIADMALIDPMYQYSLLYFTQLYGQRIQKSQKSADLAERLQILITDITESMYTMICRGLFEKDKLLFSFLIGVNIGRVEGNISEDEWNLFVRGPAVVAKTVPVNPAPSWIRQSAWQSLAAIDYIPAFAHLLNSFNDPISLAEWKVLCEIESDFLSHIPARLSSLTPFQKLLLLKILREEKIVFGAKEYVSRDLSPMFVEPLPFNLDSVYQDSLPTSPIIFVLSPGADPMSALTKLAKVKGLLGNGNPDDESGGRDRFSFISLGQGQGPLAKEMIERAKRDGGWVCLQNCHLAVSWLPQLERIVELLPTEDVHDDFRLWLSSMPTAAFPIPVLQTGIKITNEPPKGLKANVLRTFTDLDEADYESCSATHELAFKKLVFGLAFFHAVGQERRKFGAIGFNIPYEWMNSDFNVSMLQVRMYLKEQPEIPWQTLFEIIGEINYGGRVTDDKDVRCVRSLLAKCVLLTSLLFCSYFYVFSFLMIRYITPEILSDDYKFSESGKYFAPPVGDIHSVRQYVKALPPHDPPSTFGLHDNADIVFQQKETKYLLESIVSIQPRVSKLSGGKSADEVVAELARDIEARVPPNMLREDAHDSTFATIADGSMNSLGVFLLNEITRFNKLLSTIRTSLRELQRAIKGLVVMSGLSLIYA